MNARCGVVRQAGQHVGEPSRGRAVATSQGNIRPLFGTFALLAGLLLTAFGVGIGRLLWRTNVETKRVMALGTGQRNAAAALVVASQSFDEPKVVVMVVVASVVGMIVLMPLPRALARRGKPWKSDEASRIRDVASTVPSRNSQTR